MIYSLGSSRGGAGLPQNTFEGLPPAPTYCPSSEPWEVALKKKKSDFFPLPGRPPPLALPEAGGWAAGSRGSQPLRADDPRLRSHYHYKAGQTSPLSRAALSAANIKRPENIQVGPRTQTPPRSWLYL